MNDIVFPYIGPNHWTKIEPTEVAAYVSKFMDDWRFCETIRNYEQQTCYLNKWQQSDTIVEQFISNYGPVSMQLKDVDGNNVGSQVNYVTGQQDYFRPGYYIRTGTRSLAGVPFGYYYWQLSVGGSSAWVSDPFEVVEVATNTLYAQYRNYERFGDVIWETGITMNMRWPAILQFKAPGSKDTIYEDQPLNETMVKSRPYRLFDLIIGDAKGIPPWLIDKINWILGCSDLQLDGRYYTKNDGAKLEENRADYTALAGYIIEMREKFNRGGVSYQDDTVIAGYAYATAIINKKGFGTSPSSDYAEIVDIE